MDVAKLLAEYVLVLEESARATARAEDRSNYLSLMADAAPLLAEALALGIRPNLEARVFQHERLWGNLWLQDPVYLSALSAWQAAKLAYTRGAA